MTPLARPREQPVRPWYRIKRWMYRTGSPNALARAMIRLDVAQVGAGRLSPERAVVLEVPGRRSGRLISVPVVVVNWEDHRYLVAMLGDEANWVRNVRAAGGRASLRRGSREAVRLEEVDVADRPPVLKRYLALAPGARPHFPIGRSAPLGEYERIADRFPVFRVVAG